MSSEILITSYKVNDQFYNGYFYDLNPDIAFGTNLIGSVMEGIKVRQTLNLTFGYVNPSGVTVDVSTSGTSHIIRLSSGSWLDEDIAVGDAFEITIAKGVDVYNSGGQVEFINNESLIISSLIGVPDDTDYNYILMRGINGQFALQYGFGLIENSASFSVKNFLTGSDQGFYAEGIGLYIGGGVRSTDWVDMLPLGESRDWLTGSARVRYVQNTDTYTQQFEIEHDFTVLPYYLPGGTTAELFAGNNSIKYVSSFEFRSTLSAPSASKSAVIDYVEGFVGSFNENLNGLLPDYGVTSISYTDFGSGAPVDALLLKDETEVTITVQRKSGNFSANTRFGLYFSLLLDEESEYIGTQTDYNENHLYDKVLFSDLSSSSGTGVIGFTSASVTDDTAVITSRIELSTAQKDRLIQKDENRYIIGVICADTGVQPSAQDKVSLVADSNTFSDEIILEGLAYSIGFEIFRHDQNYTEVTGSTDARVWNESGVLLRFQFLTDLLKLTSINSIKQKVIAYNETTGDYFDLDSLSIPVSGAAIVNGAQQIQVDRERGYLLKEGDQFNLVKINPLLNVADTQLYEIYTGQKTPWQEWQSVLADTVFFDPNEPENGLNRKSSRYSEENGYTVRFAYELELSGVDEDGRNGTTDYLFVSPTIEVNGYLEPDTATAVIETYDPDTMAPLDGAVLTNKRTLFRIRWTVVGETVEDISDYWAIHRCEVPNQSGSAIEELSTIRAPRNGCPLEPLDGDLRLNIYADEGDAVTECYVNPELIDTSNGLNLSGEIFTGGSLIPVGAKLLEDGTTKLTEDGEVKTIE